MTASHYPHAKASAVFEELLVARRPRASFIGMIRRLLGLN
jgi:hypothetical protein